jgi:predicted AAA+ superfamily ATPase
MAVVYHRWYASLFSQKLERPFVHIMFGARQTGKSTLINSLLPADAIKINLADPAQRARHLSQPGEFAEMCKALPAARQGQVVFVDEVQSVPAIFDSVQNLYDGDKSRWRFVLCGSSARRLRKSGANLLPGRSFLHRLYPLIMEEHPAPSTPGTGGSLLLPVTSDEPLEPSERFPCWSLEERLAFGSLPGVVAAETRDRPELLKAFSVVHLEEEIRRESLVRDWGGFLRFLQFAATGSGQVLNYAAVSQETGVSQPTVKSYYQLLEGMFVAYRVPAWTRSQRKNLLSTPRFFLFDMGVRHAAAGLLPSVDIVRANPGPFFEQWVGIELWKRLQYLDAGRLFYLRSKTGAEIDFIVEQGDMLIPIEVKWTENPSLQDARHLLSFMEEFPRRAKQGFIVCRCPRPLMLHEKITAIPWSCL